MSKGNKVDLLVIGAGATGACVAYEATRRGLTVALIDAGDIGGSTSCRSTKLLHGGVRYLELAFKTFDLSQLKLVREALLERGHWLEQVPFLAKRLELALPTEDCLGKAYYRAGLGIYDILSGSQNIGSSRLLSKDQLRKALPLIKDELNGGVAYSDGQFNDARLNLLLALSAKRAGAVIRSHCKVINLEQRKDGKLCGASTKDLFGNQEQWEASAIVNATGIHIDTIRQKVDPNAAPKMFTSRGVHLVLKENLCPEGMGLLLPKTDDGRVLFVLPFFGFTQVGTTDTPCNIENANHPSQAEQQYLINHLQRWFPRIGQPSVKSFWAGGRPLLMPEGNSSDSSRVVREHEIETLPCGLISAMGGKWTTCRPIAVETLKALESVLEKSLPIRKSIPLLGTAINPLNTNTHLMKQKQELRDYLPDTSLREKQIAHLQENYGLEALSIIQKSSLESRVPISEVIPLCEAEISYAINHEHALTSTDILARRSRLAMVDLSEAKRLQPIVHMHLESAGCKKSELDLKY